MNLIPSAPAKIELGHVTHLYLSTTRAFMAVKDINLRVEEGEFILFGWSQWLRKDDIALPDSRAGEAYSGQSHD